LIQSNVVQPPAQDAAGCPLQLIWDVPVPWNLQRQMQSTQGSGEAMCITHELMLSTLAGMHLTQPARLLQSVHHLMEV
jgi:hypothetical protein